jgi:hypothetical protein
MRAHIYFFHCCSVFFQFLLRLHLKSAGGGGFGDRSYKQVDPRAEVMEPSETVEHALASTLDISFLLSGINFGVPLPLLVPMVTERLQ